MNKRYFYILSTVLSVFVAIAVFVFAYGSNDPTVLGHSSGELEVTSASIVDNTIQTVDLADGAVNGSKLKIVGCEDGYSIRNFSADGTIICEDDDDSQYCWDGGCNGYVTTERVYATSSAYIGSTPPSSYPATLRVDGISYGIQTDGSNYGIVSTGGTCAYYSLSSAPGDYCTSSSKRWKENVVPIDNVLSKIQNFDGVYFDWDEEHGGRHDLGFIAEEVGEEFPEVVLYDETGIYADAMDYTKMTAVLFQGIKELKAENDALKELVCTDHPNADICN